MTITEFYEMLNRVENQDPDTGNLFSKAYIYLYNPKEEYFTQEQILEIKSRMIRPNNYQDILVLDIFHLFTEYLKQKSFGKQILYDFLMNREKQDPVKVSETLSREAKNKDFFAYINQQIQNHFDINTNNKKAYVTMHGFGNIFPYLRVNRFVSNFEKYFVDAKYRLFIFYPGKVDDYFRLFELLNDEHPYRAIKLVNPTN